MRNLFVAVLAALLALPAFATVNPMKDVSAATLPIEVNGTNVRYCSAVVIAPGKILTAAHCISNDVAYPVVRVGDKQLRIVAWDISHSGKDVAIGTVPGLECPCVPVGELSDVYRGQKVLVLGYPDGGPLVVGEGVIITLSRTVCYAVFDCRPQATTTAPARGGNSGGPVVIIRDSKVYLIGILVGGIKDTTEHVSTFEHVVPGAQLQRK